MENISPVSKFVVKPFKDNNAFSYLEFTVKGKDYKFAMSNYCLLKLIEDNLTATGLMPGGTTYQRILK